MPGRCIRTDTVRAIEAYRIVEQAVPEPGAGEVRLRIAACGVGHVDALHATGRYQMAATVPFVPGVEVAGIVDALGPDVEGLAVGERVLSMVTVKDGFSDYTLVPARHLAKLPASMGLAEAASIRVNALTALYALKDRGQVRVGETVLVFGAAGGVGSAAVTIAQILGARVIAAASTEEKRLYARALGSAACVDTAPEGWRDRLADAAARVSGEANGRGQLDVVFDPVCGPLFGPAFRSLGWKGRHLVIGFVAGKIPYLKANLPLLKGASLVGVDIRNFNLREADAAEANRDLLRQWLADGTFPPPPVQTFAFERFREALLNAASGKTPGKTVLVMD
ncbi:NADPH:quinone oxidoreductase family protein [Croceicoccus sp. BE223]|uniref:NADPH:quinone oxidoreductase family protein n=1 Tax=Croceicoccus sp. BE223 TaxID=2817716 RepID=UPI00285900E6|nr:NADPH:quinone oxidoreductase family protein [Croceicoccus sp. BE223]MDR7103708.1 NADPH2:quinone reductase [Croceicoccus sp. BE223]